MCSPIFATPPPHTASNAIFHDAPFFFLICSLLIRCLFSPSLFIFHHFLHCYPEVLEIRWICPKRIFFVEIAFPSHSYNLNKYMYIVERREERRRNEETYIERSHILHILLHRLSNSTGVFYIIYALKFIYVICITIENSQKNRIQTKRHVTRPQRETITDTLRAKFTFQ